MPSPNVDHSLILDLRVLPRSRRLKTLQKQFRLSFSCWHFATLTRQDANAVSSDMDGPFAAVNLKGLKCPSHPVFSVSSSLSQYFDNPGSNHPNFDAFGGGGRGNAE